MTEKKHKGTHEEQYAQDLYMYTNLDYTICIN